MRPLWQFESGNMMTKHLTWGCHVHQHAPGAQRSQNLPATVGTANNGFTGTRPCRGQSVQTPHGRQGTCPRSQKQVQSWDQNPQCLFLYRVSIGIPSGIAGEKKWKSLDFRKASEIKIYASPQRYSPGSENLESSCGIVKLISPAERDLGLSVGRCSQKKRISLKIEHPESAVPSTLINRFHICSLL